MKKVAVIMGSDSDLPVVEKAIATLDEYGVPCEVHVYSAHRTPEQAKEFASGARENGFGAQSIMSMVENAWGGFGASFGPVIILSLFWKRLTYKGAIAGVVGGAVTDVLWLVFLTAKTGVYELLPGFVVGALCCIIVTLLDKKPGKDIEELYQKAVDASIDD